jgi:hypothetical protein
VHHWFKGEVPAERKPVIRMMMMVVVVVVMVGNKELKQYKLLYLTPD